MIDQHPFSLKAMLPHSIGRSTVQPKTKSECPRNTKKLGNLLLHGQEPDLSQLDDEARTRPWIRSQADSLVPPTCALPCQTRNLSATASDLHLRIAMTVTMVLAKVAGISQEMQEHLRSEQTGTASLSQGSCSFGRILHSSLPCLGQQSVCGPSDVNSKDPRLMACLASPMYRRTKVMPAS